MMPNFMAYPSAGDAKDHPLSPSSIKHKASTDLSSPQSTPTRKSKKNQKRRWGKARKSNDGDDQGSLVDSDAASAPATPSTLRSRAVEDESETPTRAGSISKNEEDRESTGQGRPAIGQQPLPRNPLWPTVQLVPASRPADRDQVPVQSETLFHARDPRPQVQLHDSNRSSRDEGSRQIQRTFTGQSRRSDIVVPQSHAGQLRSTVSRSAISTTPSPAPRPISDDIKRRKSRKSDPVREEPSVIEVTHPPPIGINQHRLGLAGLDSIVPKSELDTKPNPSVTCRREIYLDAVNNLLSAKRISELVPDDNEAKNILDAAAFQGDDPVAGYVVLDAPPKARKALFKRKGSSGDQDAHRSLAETLGSWNRSGSVVQQTDDDGFGKATSRNFPSPTSSGTWSLVGSIRRSISIRSVSSKNSSAKTCSDGRTSPSALTRPLSLASSLRRSFSVKTNVDSPQDKPLSTAQYIVEAPEEPLEEHKLGDHIDHSWKIASTINECDIADDAASSFAKDKKKAAQQVQDNTKAMQKSLDAMHKTFTLLEQASDEAEMDRLMKEVEAIKADVDKIFEASGSSLPGASKADRKSGEQGVKGKDRRSKDGPGLGFPSSKREMPVFVYGTLMCPDILARVAEISYPKYVASWMTPSILKGFARFGIGGVQNPGMVPVMSWEQKQGVERKIGEPIVMGADGELHGRAARTVFSNVSIERNIGQNRDGRDDDFQVNGMLTFGLSEEKFNKLDKYAGGMFQKCIVQVWTQVRPAGTLIRSPNLNRPSAWTSTSSLPLTPTFSNAAENSPLAPYSSTFNTSTAQLSTPANDDIRAPSRSSTRKSSLQNLRSRAASISTPPQLLPPQRAAPTIPTAEDQAERQRIRAIVERTRNLRFGPMAPTTEQAAAGRPEMAPQLDGPADARARGYASPEEYMGPAAATMHRLASASLRHGTQTATAKDIGLVLVPVLAWTWVYVGRIGDLVPPSRGVWSVEELIRAAP